MPYANNKGADQPAHPRSLISAFVIRCTDSIIPLVSISKISSLYLASEAEQAGFSLTWSQTPTTGFLVTWLKYESCLAHENTFHRNIIIFHALKQYRNMDVVHLQTLQNANAHSLIGKQNETDFERPCLYLGSSSFVKLFLACSLNVSYCLFQTRRNPQTTTTMTSRAATSDASHHGDSGNACHCGAQPNATPGNKSSYLPSWKREQFRMRIYRMLWELKPRSDEVGA